MELSTQRKFLHPQTADDWQSIALRALPEMEEEVAVGQLQSWNLHVFMRPGVPGAPTVQGKILPCDVIFLEPPLGDAAGA